MSFKLFVENKALQKENLALHEENKENRQELEEKNITLYRVRNSLSELLKDLDDIQDINKRNNDEEYKKQLRNRSVNSATRKILDIKRELDSPLKHI